VFPVLHEAPQIHSFRVTSDTCSGFNIASDVLLQLAQKNGAFWERLWKTAGIELIKYFFKEQEVFATFDLTNLGVLHV